MKKAIVTTAINIPHHLKGYIENLKKHNLKDITSIIICGLKTPESMVKYLKGLNKKSVYKLDYRDIDRQKAASGDMTR